MLPSNLAGIDNDVKEEYCAAIASGHRNLTSASSALSRDQSVLSVGWLSYSSCDLLA
jgi:hypothetical protein